MTLLLWLSDKHSWLYYSEGKRIICFAWWFLVHTSLEQGKCNTSLLKKKDYLFWTYLKKTTLLLLQILKRFTQQNFFTKRWEAYRNSLVYYSKFLLLLKLSYLFLKHNWAHHKNPKFNMPICALPWLRLGTSLLYSSLPVM